MEAVTPVAEEPFTDCVRRVEPRPRISLMAGYVPERSREAAAEALAYAWEHWDRIALTEHPVGFLYRAGQSKTRIRRRPPLRAAEPEQREP
jgi:predicted RNA polymerase sigma factor